MMLGTKAPGMAARTETEMDMEMEMAITGRARVEITGRAMVKATFTEVVIEMGITKVGMAAEAAAKVLTVVTIIVATFKV
jgi:hypothetical protein